MTANQLLVRVRIRLGDMAKVVYSDTELMSYLNDGIASLSDELISAGDPELIKEMSVSGKGTNKPTEFVNMVGLYPVEFKDGKFYQLDVAADPMTVRYFARRTPVTVITGELPFDNPIHQAMLADRVVMAAVAARGGAK